MLRYGENKICIFWSFVCILSMACYKGIVFRLLSQVILPIFPWLIILILAVSIHDSLFLVLGKQKSFQGSDLKNLKTYFLGIFSFITCTVFPYEL
jgi:hypothetical protein